MEKIFKKIDLDAKWKKVNLKKFNDFYLIAIKKNKNSKKSTLDKDCIKKIKFEFAVDSGKKGKYLYYNQLIANFNDIASKDTEFDRQVASVKVSGYPSTFYIKATEVTGEFSTVTEGTSSIEVYINELRLK